MVKKIVIPLILVASLAILFFSLSRQTEFRTVPVAPPPSVIEQEQPSPRAEPETGTPTPRAPEAEPPQGGIPVEVVFPQEVNLWVNNIFVPFNTDFEGGRFIRIEDDDVKVFAGSFGPYPEDPTAHLRVELCAELTKGVAAQACEVVPIAYRDRYVTFAKGYQFDEFIGGSAAKDYSTYYVVYVGDTKVGQSSKAVIRTVRAS